MVSAVQTQSAGAGFFANLGGFLMGNSDVNSIDGQKEIFARYNAVDIASLPTDVLQAIFAGAKLGDLQKQVSKAAAVASLDYESARDKFLAGFESKSTQRLYRYGLDALEAFCQNQGLQVLAVKISDAREFICYLKTSETKDGAGLSNNSVRAYIGAVSSFFSWLRLESNGAIELNPFERLGRSGGKPKARLKSKVAYPTTQDVATYVEYFESKGKDVESVIIQMMANDGFRVGAFETMTISDKGRASFTSKGKNYTARRLSQASLNALNGARGEPFAGYSAKKIQNEIMNAGKKLVSQGKLSTVFSPHDFRHYYATELYKATKDIRKVQIALGHSNIAVTDTYLRGLGVLTD